MREHASNERGGGAESGPGPDPAVAASEYALSLLRAQLGRWRRHEPGARFGEDPDDTHDMRVAAQRLRAILRFFACCLPGDPVALRCELGWVRRQLGPVRDLDVQLEQLKSWREELEQDGLALGSIETRLRARRVEERFVMLSALDSDRARQAFAALERMLAPRPCPSAEGADEPIGLAAPPLIVRAHRRARRAARAVSPEARDERFHRLRRRLRELRYVVEFHEPLYGRDARRYIRRLVSLQDALGALQDSAVARARLRRLVEDEGIGTSAHDAFAIGKLHERYVQEADAVREGMTDAAAVIDCGKWRKLRRKLRARRLDRDPGEDQS